MNTQETEVITAQQLVILDKPQHLMRQATDIASVCRDIAIKSSCQIQGKKYLKAEGWMAIAMAHGCIASSRDVHKIEGGFTAVGEIKRISDGVILSTAEGFVGRDEKRWKTADEYACRAMAQTRAISRACRAAFAHIVVMMDAGLSTTPMEEVPDGGFTNEPEAPKAFVPPAGMKTAAEIKPPVFEYEKFRDRMLHNLFEDKFSQPDIKEFAVKSGILLIDQALTDWPCDQVPRDKGQMDALKERLKSFVAGVPVDSQPPATTQPSELQAQDWPTEELPTSAGWKEVVHPIKKLKLGDMDEKDLKWWCENYRVTTSFEKDGKTINKKEASIAKDQAFRDALDQAAKYCGF